MSSLRLPSRRRRVLLLLVACVLLLGACAGRRTIPDKYGDTTKDNFQEGCLEALTVKTTDEGTEGFTATDVGEAQPFTAERAGKVCTCSYEGISDPQTGIPFEEFKKINDTFEDDPGPLPDSITSIISTCVDDNPA